MLLLNLLVIPSAGLLWFLGGRGADLDYDTSVLRLHKNWRRIVWPVLMGLLCVGNGLPWLLSMGVAAGLWVANILPYGDRTSWPVRIGVSALLGAPALLLHWDLAFPLVTVVEFTLLHLLSLKKNWMSWPVVEALTGATQAAVMVAALMVR